MPYTLWSHGRLLGQSGLSYARCLVRIRAGDFEPTEVGESLLPILTGMGPAVEALAEIMDSHAKPAGASEESPGLHDCVRLTTEYADIRSIGDQLENLALELRDPKGERVPTSLIGIQDTEHLLALARRNDVIPIEEEDDLEEWLPRPSRYQIIVEMEADEEMCDIEGHSHGPLSPE